MYLFILESIGTSELIVIGLVALIFLGPRKLPELARSIGKAMNEFRRSTNDFKQTWEREVVSEVNSLKTETRINTFLEDSLEPENSSEKFIAGKNAIAAPAIKEVSTADFQEVVLVDKTEMKKETETDISAAGKQSWL